MTYPQERLDPLSPILWSQREIRHSLFFGWRLTGYTGLDNYMHIARAKELFVDIEGLTPDVIAWRTRCWGSQIFNAPEHVVEAAVALMIAGNRQAALDLVLPYWLERW